MHQQASYGILRRGDQNILPLGNRIGQNHVPKIRNRPQHAILVMVVFHFRFIRKLVAKCNPNLLSASQLGKKW
jgi:hypothetical protein